MLTKDMRIKNLTNPVTAAKADWLPGTTWLGFTPPSSEPHAASQCEATSCRQMKDGCVLEYITHSIDHPNRGFEDDPEYLDAANEHPKLAGRLVAVHRLRPTDDAASTADPRRHRIRASARHVGATG